MDRESHRPPAEEPTKEDTTRPDTHEPPDDAPGSGDPRRDARAAADATRDDRSDREPSGPLPDIVRKALAMGFTSFFTTEQTIRKALGDTLPQDWIDFVADQSERTRGDFTEAIASEVGRSLRSIDLTQVADQLLTGRTVEVSARIRLLPLDDEEPKPEESDT